MLNRIIQERRQRAELIARHGDIRTAIASGGLPSRSDVTLSEAIVLGLYHQNVRRFIGIFGHGSTDVAEVLRVYEEVGLVKTVAVRHETEAVHAATALRWVTGEKSAIVTSIGPGALHALAGSLTPLSNGLGIWFLLGDETTEDEGPNMQQIPGHVQGSFHRLFSAMGPTYTLHTPQAVGMALRRGLAATDHPFRQQPFYLLMPMNRQPAVIRGFNFREIPGPGLPTPIQVAADEQLREAVEAIGRSERIVLKAGGGCKALGGELIEFLDRIDGVAVHSPLVPGVIPFSHPRNMCVGGSKGSISGNYAMEHADLLISVGTRFVCQSDCSRTGYPSVKTVININPDLNSAIHYSDSISLVGEAGETIRRLLVLLPAQKKVDASSTWFEACREKRTEWDRFRQKRYNSPTLFDETWQKAVLTQPAVIKTATDWALKNGIRMFFDAGDVQANGFQIVEAETPGQVFTDTGASYMGFAASALLSTGLASPPFYGLALCGDGSFVMNPQILIDGVEHGARGCILLLDNRRMGAISGLQQAQYEAEHATRDSVTVDYMGWAQSIAGVQAFDAGNSLETLTTALESAGNYDGLSMVYVQVYYGDDPLGGMGVFGRWNVGNWCEETQALRHEIGL